jgi:SAM-dependent methyltransferase
MKRNIIVTIDNSIDDEDHVHVNNLSSTVNYSCDSISLYVLEYLKEKDHIILVKSLLEKLRPGGRLLLAANNAKSIAQQFVNSSISHESFLKFFTNKQSLVSLESLYTMIDFEFFDIIDLDINNNTIKLVIERKHI